MGEIISIVLNYIIPLILGGFIGYLKAKQKESKEKDKIQKDKDRAIEEGLVALLRNELVRRYREYETKGEISILDKENMEDMFEQYEKLRWKRNSKTTNVRSFRA